MSLTRRDLARTLAGMAKAPSNKLTAGDVQDLAVAVEQLTEVCRLLQTSVDELRDDVVWAARQALAVGDSLVPGHLRRPYDPLAPDAAPALADEGELSSEPEHAMDRPTEDCDTEAYCCAEPNLQWHGDPDAPGIACANCGYLVAEMGSVLIWRGETDEQQANQADQPAEPEQHQGELF